MFNSSTGVIALNRESSPLVVSDMHQIARARQQSAEKSQECTIHVGETPPGPLVVILLGKTGNGKSAVGNLLIGRDEFLSQAGMGSVTQDSARALGNWKGEQLIVLDTPGLGDPSTTSQITRSKIEAGIAAAACPGARYALVLVFGLHQRVTAEDVDLIANLELMFGRNMMSSAVAVWTHGALLESKTLDSYFLGAPPGLCALLTTVRGGSIVVENQDRTKDQAALSRDTVLEAAYTVSGPLPVPRPLGGKKARRMRQETARRAAAEQARLNPQESSWWCSIS